jgi:multicomponent Na+:H+ antiporter subunit C
VSFLPYAVAVWLFVIGLYGVVTSRNFIHMLICLSVAQSATYVLLLAIGYRTGGKAPIFGDIPMGTKVVDPVVHALVLVDIVVQAVVTSLLLALAVESYSHFRTLDPEELRPMKG